MMRKADPSADDLWRTDALAWSREQSALLARVARGERVNGIDWPHVIEEIADLGLSELRTVRSLLIQALVHMVKIAAEQDAQAVAHWATEARSFLDQAADRFSPSMRQALDLDKIYETARMRAERDLGDAAPVWPDLPLSLDDLLDVRTDPIRAAATLRRQP